eukprot:gene10063-7033_t
MWSTRHITFPEPSLGAEAKQKVAWVILVLLDTLLLVSKWLHVDYHRFLFRTAPHAVTGKILVTSEEGERVSQWGGTECYLSWQTALGPCLVVRSSKHKKGAGTFFPLKDIRQVLSAFVNEGKLTVVVPHGKHVCTVLIQTPTDVEELFTMAGVIQNRSQWKTLERNVGCKRSREGNQLRDPTVAQRGPIVMEGGSLEGPAHSDDDDSASDDGGASLGGNSALPWVVRKTAPTPPPQPPLKVQKIEEENLVEIDAVSQQIGAAPGLSNVMGMDEEQWRTAAAALDAGKGGPQRKQPVTQAAGSVGAMMSTNWSREAKLAVHHVLAGKNVFVTGAAGTGKTAWLLHLMAEVLPRRSVYYIPTATTGVAARVLGGSTIYSFAGIGRGEGTLDTILKRVHSHADVVRGWRQCELLIIDEISVLPAHIFTLLDKVARAVRKEPSKPFGGARLLLVGDFLQLPPVSRGGEEVLSAFQSPSWEACQLTCVELRASYRHQNDPVLQQACDDIRRGMFTTAVETVVSSCLHRQLSTVGGIEPTTLLCRLKEVEAHNTKMLNEIDSVSFHRYHSVDYAAEPGSNLDAEFSLPGLLTLKEGAQVVLVSSIPDYPQLANGDLGVVVGFKEQSHDEFLPVVQFISACGANQGREVTAVIPRVKVEVLGRDGLFITMSRTQIPLQLAWALTIHRVQGMTISMARVQMDRSFFECGQAYVAISRVRRREDLCLTAFDVGAIQASPAAVAFYEKVFPMSTRDKMALEAPTVGGDYSRIDHMTWVTSKLKQEFKWYFAGQSELTITESPS